MDNIHMRQKPKSKKKKKDYNERYKLWKTVEGYTIEVGYEENGKLDTCKFKQWCEGKSIQLPKIIQRFWKAFRDFEGSRETKEGET